MLPALQNFFSLTSLLLVSFTMQGQYWFEKAVNLNKESGLPSNIVRAITKDEKGFIWLATSNGLCRYDGLQVKIFNQGSDPKYSPFDNTITSLLARKNKLWFGTMQGLSVLNTEDFTFKHYQFTSKGKTDSLKRRFDQHVTVVYEDHSGKIWIGTADRGVAMYNDAMDDFHFYPLSTEKYTPLLPSLGSPLSILSIQASETNDSIIWAGSWAGLHQINKFTGKVELLTYPNEDKNFQVAQNAFRYLYHHDDGLVYVGSWAAGINIFDPVTRTFTPLNVKSETGNKIIKAVTASIFRKSDHEIWISTLLGLAVYDTRLKDVTWYILNNQNELKFYSIRYIDEVNRIWCSHIGGVSIYDPVIHQFSVHPYTKDWIFSYYILSDNKGEKITVCPRFTDGTYTLDKTTNTWTKTTFPGNASFNKETDVVKGFVQLSPGEYVISSDKGVYRYSANKKTIHRVNDGFPFDISRRGDMLLDKAGNIWLTDNTWGLTKWNPGTGKFVNYKNETLLGDSIGVTTRLLNLYEDSRGNIWFQMPGGFGVYVASKEKIYSFIYSKNETNSFAKANSFAEDAKGRVWMASTDGWMGYASLNEPEKGAIKKINIREHQIAGEVQHLATDRKGNVWGHTENTLLKINSGDSSIQTYDFNYGIREDEVVNFSFLPSGEMIIGGRSGIILANPDELKRNPEIPLPYISELQVLNQPYIQLLKGETLSLKYRQNFFSINFSAIAYTLSGGVKFRYRLSGFNDWSAPTERRFANFTNVPGGNYVFQLQASNNEGVWNKTVLELPVHIVTPFWQTLWFRIAVVLLLSLLVYGYYLYRMNQFRKKEKLKSEYEKKIANVEMSSLLAQMNPHFLFNSLNSIDSYIIKNETHKASEYLNNFARLMRLILQNSRSNYISLKDELETLNLYMQMESLRFKNKFDYSVTVCGEINTASIVIPPMLIQPFVENAIWHGLMHKQDGDPGKVEINICLEERLLKFSVQDNGIGRNKAEELKMQKTGNRKRSMGMQITGDRIEMINKLYGTDTKVKIIDLFDENNNATGTRVELEIPV
jgi:ligand-binding sensor domain-containing protein